MVYRKRIYYTDAQKAEMWDRWQRGETLHSIARLFDRYHTSVRGILDRTGGIRPREAVEAWIRLRSGVTSGYLFPSRIHRLPHHSTRQYVRIVNQWVASIGLDPHKYGTHSLRRTKAALIYKKTGNLRAVQLLLGHSKLESTVRYLGIEVDDALQISEQVEL